MAMHPAAHYRAHRLYDGRWAVVHTLPGAGSLSAGQRGVAVDVDGFPDQASAEKEAAWMNAERERDTVRWANNAGLRGVTL
jgi:hypothetical protein